MTSAVVDTEQPRAATPSAVVRTVVLSDIHATTTGSDTKVARETAGNPKGNALTGAINYLRDEVKTADLLLCPGDLVHRGDGEPMAWVWEQLHAAAADLGACVVGAVGNHDLLRMPTGDELPNSAIRALSPEFPYDDHDNVLTYWADEFAVIETSSWRVVSLNSCVNHGGFDQNEGELGRCSDRCRTALTKFLEQSDSPPQVNICMCHHHPEEWTDGSDRVARHLKQGDQLIDLLDRRPERWMLLHGHKHHPALRYLGVGSCGPLQLSAGSIGAELLGDSGTSVRNQLHVIDFEPDLQDSLGLALAGTVRSLDWRPGDGWIEASSDSGLPELAGFGYRRDGLELAHALKAEAVARDKRAWRWDEIEAEEPRCRYLTPRDREEFFHGVRLLSGGVVDRPDEGFLEVTFW